MRQTIKYLLTFIVALSPLALFGQGQFTTIGTDFWLGYNIKGTYYEIKFVSTAACTVTLDFTDGSVPQRTINIPGAGVTGYVLNLNFGIDGYDEMKAVRNGTGAANKSVRIRSSAPIGVYAINQQTALTDATAVLPVTNYGTKHIAIDGITMGDQKYLVISPEDGNKIRINGGSAITLNKGQVYAKSSINDLTGDIIISDEPVAFFNVSHSLRIPTSSTSYTDQAFEQLPPVATWGKEFLVPITQRAAEYIRVVASMDGTTVSFGGTNHTLNTGKFVDQIITEPTYISADKPIGVCTYMVGSAYKGSYGDPSISWVPSIDQHMKSATIAPFAPLAVPSTSTQLDAHWGQVVVKKNHKTDTKVNGTALTGGVWVDGPPESGLSVYNMPFLEENEGWNKSYTFTNAYGLVLLGYGTGSAESYQYLAASSSRKLDAYFTINNLHYEDANLEVPFDCGTPFNFEATIEYNMNTTAIDGYIRWFIDGAEVIAAKNKETWSLPYMSAGEHEIILRVLDTYNLVEEMKTTLNVECLTGITPTTVEIYEGESTTMTIALGSGKTPIDVTFSLAAVSPSDADPMCYTIPLSVVMSNNTNSVTFTVSTTVNNIINEPDRLLKIKASTNDYPDMHTTITIKDRPTVAQRTISLNATPISINESPGEIPNLSTVKLAFPIGVKSATPVRVNLSYAGSTATFNNDYSISKAEATNYIDIPENQNEITFTITARQDYILEGDENVVIAATAPTDYTMQAGSSSTTVTIKDKTLGSIIVKSLENAAEPSTNGKFWIGFKEENVKSTQNVIVSYVLSGTAEEGVNYESLAPYKATIPAGENGVEVAVSVINNFRIEGLRTLNIEITSID